MFALCGSYLTLRSCLALECRSCLALSRSCPALFRSCLVLSRGFAAH